jgi:hypothetical protein
MHSILAPSRESVTNVYQGKKPRLSVRVVELLLTRTNHSSDTYYIDYAYDCTIPVSGETLTAGRFLRWYSRRMNIVGSYVRLINDVLLNSNIRLRCTPQDGQVGTALHYGIHLLSPTIDYFQPSIVLKVLWDALRRPHA